MADEYSAHSQFVSITSHRRRQWLDSKTIFLMTIITLPVIIFSGIYMIILNGNDSITYPKSSLEVPSLWINRAKAYSNYPKKTRINNEQENLQKIPIKYFNEPNNFKLVCYYNFPDVNKNGLPPDKIDPFLCTHINIGFFSITNNTLNLEQNEIDTIQSVVVLKQTNPDLKILISVGGAGNDQGFNNMVLTHLTRKHFIHSVLELVKTYKIDGVDLDWEFPSSKTSDDPNQSIHFTQLLEEFRMVINKQTKHKFLLSLAVAAPVFLVDNSYRIISINEYVDFINLMSYDYHFYTKFTPFTGLNSPLYQSIEDNGYFSTLNINFTANYWSLKGMDKNKINIGLPTYGHTFRLMNVHNHGLYAPARGYGKLGSNGFVDYGQICTFLSTNQIQPVFNMESKSPYAFKGAEWISFDNEQSISYKTEFVRDHNFGGVMVYSLNADDYMGVCQSDPRILNKTEFALTRKIREILDKNYSLL